MHHFQRRQDRYKMLRDLVPRLFMQNIAVVLFVVIWTVQLQITFLNSCNALKKARRLRKLMWWGSHEWTTKPVL